jgi:hypothetical protein
VTRMSTCNCKVCSDHRRWLAALNPQTDRARAAFDEILSRIEGAETDAAVSQAKLDGSWPVDRCKHGVIIDHSGSYICVKCFREPG